MAKGDSGKGGGRGKAPEKGRRRKWRKLLIAFLSSGALLLLLLLFLLFSAHPRYPVPALSVADVAFQSKMIMQEMPKIYRGKPEDLSELELTPEEVRSLLRFVANGVNIAGLFRSGSRGGDGSCNDYLVNYRDDGIFEIDAAYDTGLPLLFGGHIRVFVAGRPQLLDDELNFAVDSAQVGLLPVPRRLADRVAGKLIEKNYGHRELKRVRRIIRTLTVDPESGKLRMVYRPREVKRF